MLLRSALTITTARHKALPGLDQLAPGGGSLSVLGQRGARRTITDAELLKIDETGPPYAALALDALAGPESAALWSVWGPPAGKSRSRALAAKARVLACEPGEKRIELLKSFHEDQELEPKPDHPWTLMIRKGTMGVGPPWLWIPGSEVLALTRKYIQTLGEMCWFLDRRPVQIGGTTVRIPVGWAPIPPTWLETPTKKHPGFKLKAPGLGLSAGASIPARDVVYYRRPGLTNPYKRGVGTLQALAEDLALDEAQVTYMNAVMANMGEPRYLFVAPGMPEPERDAFLQRVQGRGPGRAGRVVTVSPPDGSAEIKLIRMGDSPADLEAYEGRQHNRDAFLHVNRVAPGAVGVQENSNRAVAHVAREDLRSVVKFNLERMREFYQARFFEPLGNRPAEYAGEDRLVCAWELPPLQDKDLASGLVRTATEFFSERDIRQLAGLPGGDPHRHLKRQAIEILDDDQGG